MATAQTRFGRYTIAGTLGKGGFAEVFRAWDPALNREVALKALLPHHADDPETYRRFMAEAQALAGLQHPHIVQVHDVGDAAGRPFFTMELIRGRTLEEALRTGGGPTLPACSRSCGSSPQHSTTSIGPATCIAISSRPT